MNYKTMFLTLSIVGLLLSLNACSIEGEEICGIWHTNGDYGQMKIEITPWDGQFHGYLLEYKNGKEIHKGAKTEEHIFLMDLVYEANMYKNGKIYLDPSSEETCGISLKMLDNHQVQASYTCQGQTYQETWTREGYTNTKKVVAEKEMLASTKEETMGKEVVSQSNGTSKNNAMTTSPSSAATTKEKEIATEKKPMTAKETTKAETAKTQAQSTFYVIGISQTVAYEDTKALEKAVENLWKKCYNEDFSAQLANITDSENMYVTYSNYDQPKGKMNITIGYKVKNLSDLPKGLKGVKVPNNDYYTYDLSGSASDYEGEEWGQLGELMAYRKATSVDFEVYQFDNNYEVKAAKMWIAAK